MQETYSALHLISHFQLSWRASKTQRVTSSLEPAFLAVAALQREFDGFDWDDGHIGHCRKHGLTEVEIEAALSGDVLVAPDVAHSDKEDCFLAIGRNDNGRPFCG